MAKINTKNRGITLIELILYMSIFSIIFLTIMSSVFYLQKIIQTNNQNYYIKNQIYDNINILQQYLYKSQVSITSHTLTLLDKNNTLILNQTLQHGQLKNRYGNKTITIMEQVIFKAFNLEMLDNNRVLKIEFSWLDSRGKTQSLVEYLIVINQNL